MPQQVSPVAVKLSVAEAVLVHAELFAELPMLVTSDDAQKMSIKI